MFRAWLASALAGEAALGLCRALAPWLGFSVALNAVSLGTAAVLGAPGTVLLLFLRVLFLRAA